jgi:DeoR family fructose operon transcriptional repressor
MLIVERQSRLQEFIARAGVSDLDAISRELGVSQSTVRRDVEALEKRGIVRRTHGGVIWVGERERGAEAHPYVFHQRIGVFEANKRRIAKEAAKLVEPRQTILIDGGTTTFFLAQELLGRTLQIVTNSLPIADVFLDAQDVELILTGGVLSPRYGILLGPIADQALAAVHTMMMFFSVAGINEGSLFNQNLLMVQTERRMMEQTQKTVLLADSSKFGQQALSRLGGLDEIDILVSDEGLSETHRQQAIDAGCQLIIAPSE